MQPWMESRPNRRETRCVGMRSESPGQSVAIHLFPISLSFFLSFFLCPCLWCLISWWWSAPAPFCAFALHERRQRRGRCRRRWLPLLHRIDMQTTSFPCYYLTTKMLSFACPSPSLSLTGQLEQRKTRKWKDGQRQHEKKVQWLQKVGARAAAATAAVIPCRPLSTRCFQMPTTGLVGWP